MKINVTLQDDVHKAWILICNELKKFFPKDDINDVKKFGKLFALIDDWGNKNALMRIFQKENGGFDITKEDGRIFKDRL